MSSSWRQRVSRLHLWAPGMFDFRGGIQTYTRLLLEALADVLPDARIHVFLKNDVRGQHQLPPADNLRFAFAGGTPERLRTARFASQLAAAVLVDRPQLIVCTHANFSPAAARLAALVKSPHWVSAHGVEVWDIGNPRVAQGLASAQRVLCVSEHTRQRLAGTNGIGVDRLSLLPNTVDESRFAPGEPSPRIRGRFGIGPDQPVILTVNRLVAEESYRGYDVVLRAFPAIRAEIPDVRWIIGGKGNDAARLDNEIKRLGLQDCVHLTGFVPDEDLPDCFRSCDLFVMPSRLEGFGIVYLEAMACGKPALGGNADGARDALDHGRLGILVDPDDHAAMAAEIIRFLKGEHPNRLLYDPVRLRAEMLALYGPARFRARLEELLAESFA